MRTAEFRRTTNETDIRIALNIDGDGAYTLSTGIPFFDHMLCMIAKHGLMDLEVQAKGDIEVDFHHTVEDVGIALGQTFGEAMGDKKGITRYASSFLPMDEALVLVAVDVSGRPYLAYDVDFATDRAGDFEACLIEEFLRGFAFAAGITLHVKKMYGSNTHHIMEAIMKGLGRALCEAATLNPRVKGIPSTKGVL